MYQKFLFVKDHDDVMRFLYHIKRMKSILSSSSYIYFNNLKFLYLKGINIKYYFYSYGEDY